MNIAGLSEEASAKNEELTNAVKELQELLQRATQEYGDLETKLQEKEVALEVTVEKKNLCIQELKKELEHANQLIEATKQRNSYLLFIPTNVVGLYFLSKHLLLMILNLTLNNQHAWFTMKLILSFDDF